MFLNTESEHLLKDLNKEPPFLYKLPSGTRLFRAATIAKEGKWYNLSLNDSYTYGSDITEYSTTKDLKLLNAMSLIFHNDFVDRLNMMYPGIHNTGFDYDKIKCLIPFGLLNKSIQQKGMDFIGLPANQNTSSQNPLSDYTGELMRDRNRISEHTLDTHLVTILDQIYGNYYDGFISPLKWPTKVHPGPGDFFPQELCFFKLGNVKEEAEHKRPTPGGAISSSLNQQLNNTAFKFDNEKAKERFKIMEKEFEEHLQRNPFVPLWNPHTEDIVSESAYVKQNTRNVRKTRKIVYQM